MCKVTGIGGIFIKSNNPETLSNWYRQNLNLDLGEHNYISFGWADEESKAASGTTAFSVFEDGNEYFKPSQSRIMINFRVKNLHLLLHTLKEKGCWVGDTVQYFDYGSFGWTMDSDGNKIELWEPKKELK